MELGADLLCDKSVLGHLHRDEVLDAFIPLVEGQRVGISSPTLLEQQISARDSASLSHMHETLIARLERVSLPDPACHRAEQVQRLLVAAGRHRDVSVPDLLVAATAEHHGLTVLHFDRDFETIAEITGQPTRWVVTPDVLSHGRPVGRRPRNRSPGLARRSPGERD